MIEILQPESALESLFTGHWETEKRAGVLHYVSGQHKVAVTVDDEGKHLFILAFTRADGHGINGLFCYHEADAWRAEDMRVRVDGFGMRLLHHPPDFELSERQTEELDKALAALNG